MKSEPQFAPVIGGENHGRSFAIVDRQVGQVIIVPMNGEHETARGVGQPNDHCETLRLGTIHTGDQQQHFWVPYLIPAEDEIEHVLKWAARPITGGRPE